MINLFQKQFQKQKQTVHPQIIRDPHLLTECLRINMVTIQMIHAIGDTEQRSHGKLSMNLLFELYNIFLQSRSDLGRICTWNQAVIGLFRQPSFKIIFIFWQSYNEIPIGLSQDSWNHNFLTSIKISIINLSKRDPPIFGNYSGLVKTWNTH